jgi:hypothetical protein
VRAPLAVLLLLGVVACGPTVRPPPTRLTTKELVQKYKPAVVRIQAEADGRVAQGSGFVVAEDGRIATNLHVIAGATKVAVTLVDGSEHPVERVVAVDVERDLAILGIARRGLPSVTLGDSDKVSAGDPVIAIGNPLGVFDFTVSDGLISSVRPLSSHFVALQISAPISQGSSGGPLFNPYGEVIGVATFISREGQNINFGVPANYLRPLLARRGRETVPQFAERFARTLDERDAPARPGDAPKIVRRVPRHEVAVLDGCRDEQLLEVFRDITEAIQIGAPVYNEGQHEACFVIYRKVAEAHAADETMCRGVRDAFAEGLRRVGEDEGFTAKAWSLRDTFDGLTDVIVRKAGAAAGP